MPHRTVAVILAGGEARRMGGTHKPLLPLAGRRLLDHILTRVRPQVDVIAISVHDDPTPYAAFNLPILQDAQGPRSGPLAGILAALRWARDEKQAETLLTLPGDTPFLPPDLLTRLHVARPPNGIAHATSAARRHPTIALWPTTLTNTLAAALAAGTRKIESFTAPHPLATADWPITPQDPFFNINTPSDLAEAERLLQSENNR